MASDDFVFFETDMRLPLAPVFMASAADSEAQLEGAREVLTSWLTKYIPSLNCVLLGFDSVSLAGSVSYFDPSTGTSNDNETDGSIPFKAVRIIPPYGHALAHVHFRGLGWRPRKKQVLTGYVTLASPSHISVLLYNLFNASIPVDAIPSDEYVYDPEYPVPGHVALTYEGAGTLADLPQNNTEQSSEKGWFRKHGPDGTPLGGNDGKVTFTVTDVTISNNIMSLTGSLRSDGSQGRSHKRKHHSEEDGRNAKKGKQSKEDKKDKKDKKGKKDKKEKK